MLKAYRTEPDYCETINDEALANFATLETRNFKAHNAEILPNVKNVEDYCFPDDFTSDGNKDAYGETLTEELTYYAPKTNGKKWNAHEVSAYKKLIAEFYDKYGFAERLAAFLKTVQTGEKWTYKTICGYSQSDWTVTIFPEREAEYLKVFEAEFFGLYDEWHIVDKDDKNGGDYWWRIYHFENAKQILKDENPDIEIYDIDGYITTPKYKRIA